MFPVKRVGRMYWNCLALRRWVPIAFSLGFGGCGYRAVNEATPVEKRLAVVASVSQVPHAEAASTVLSAVRQELSGAGALRAGEGYPRVVVEVVRVDERASAIQERGDDPVAGG